MFTPEKVAMIQKKMSITTFDSLPNDEQIRLFNKWGKKESILMERNISSLHNDGDEIITKERDY